MVRFTPLVARERTPYGNSSGAPPSRWRSACVACREGIRFGDAWVACACGEPWVRLSPRRFVCHDLRDGAARSQQDHLPAKDARQRRVRGLRRGDRRLGGRARAVPGGGWRGVGVLAGRYHSNMAHVTKLTKSEVERRRAAAERMRGLFADVAPDRSLVDELIADRRAEAAAESGESAVRRRRGG